jgi:uncharacterized protein YcfJ
VRKSSSWLKKKKTENEMILHIVGALATGNCGNQIRKGRRRSIGSQSSVYSGDIFPGSILSAERRS